MAAHLLTPLAEVDNIRVYLTSDDVLRYSGSYDGDGTTFEGTVIYGDFYFVAVDQDAASADTGDTGVTDQEALVDWSEVYIVEDGTSETLCQINDWYIEYVGP